LLGFSASQLNRITVAPISVTELNRDITELQSHMNPVDFTAARAEGETMTLEQALSYALEADS
jgi:hypothetical protein